MVDMKVLFKHCFSDEDGSQMLERLEGNSGLCFFLNCFAQFDQCTAVGKQAAFV